MNTANARYDHPAQVWSLVFGVLADTGSEKDLISRTDTQVHFPGTIGKSERPVSLITANGPERIGQLDVPELGTLECYVLESTPPVCLIG